MSEEGKVEEKKSSSEFEPFEEFYIQKVDLAGIVKEHLIRYSRAGSWDEKSDIVDSLISVLPITLQVQIEEIFPQLWEDEQKELMKLRAQLEDPAVIIGTDDVGYAKLVEEYEEEYIKRYTIVRLRSVLAVLEEYNLIPKPVKVEVLEL